MPYIKVWIHAVWSTKNRRPLLSQKIRKTVFDHIRENAASKDIYIDMINGYVDHVHCLISLKSDQSIAKCMQLIKGESAYWINKNKLTSSKFEWQDAYYVASLSSSDLGRVRNYIRNQEEHHRKKQPFSEEYEEFIRAFPS